MDVIRDNSVVDSAVVLELLVLGDEEEFVWEVVLFEGVLVESDERRRCSCWIFMNRR